MADYDIAAVTRRAVYSGSAGTGPYAFSFACLETSDIAVYKDTTLLTETSDYTVTLSPTTGTGSITLAVAANSGNTITLVGARDLARTTDFVTAGSLTASALNADFDSLVIFAQQLSEENSRNLKAPVTEGISGSTDMTLPAKADRLGKYLAFNATTGNPEAGPDQTDVVTLAAITSDIATLADIEDGTDATDAIQTVAGISANVTTVAGVSSNVTTVAGISADVTSVAGDATDIGTVATNIASVNTVATNIADVVTVANDLNEAISEIETAANDLNEATSEIDTVATSISNVDAVGTNIANVNTVAGISANVTTVAGISANTTTVAGIASDVTTVAGISADTTTVAGIDSNVTTVAGISGNVTTVAGISANVTTVAGVSANVTTVATDIANVNTTATNITGVNSFAERYRVGSSDPVASLDEGDLFYNSTDNEVKYYNGSAWASITAGIGNVVEDITPQLGGNLDLNSNDITGTGNLNFTGSITLTGNVDGRDVSTDGTKLDGIATSATANPDAIDNVVEDTTPQLGGTLDANGNTIDMDGNELILDADADTSITADTDDRIDLRVGGADRAYITANTIGGIINRRNAKPLMINGDMQVAQRGTSTTGVTSTTMATCDRVNFYLSSAGTWTIKQTADAPTGSGFRACYELDCTTADGSLSASDQARIELKFEGQDVQLFKKGTSSAEKMTVSFWVKSIKTGTHVLQAYDADNSRSVSKQYTISSSDTWEYKVVNIPADTTGAFTNDNAESLNLSWWIAAGTDFTSGTINETWESRDLTKIADGQVNGADSTSNNYRITGIQIEVGEYDTTTIPPFQHESFGDNLRRCQRYYEKTSPYGTLEGAGTNPGISITTGSNDGGGVSYQVQSFKVEKRDTPTIATWAPNGEAGKWSSNALGVASANRTAAATGPNTASFYIAVTVTGAHIVSQIFGHYKADAEL